MAKFDTIHKGVVCQVLDTFTFPAQIQGGICGPQGAAQSVALITAFLIAMPDGQYHWVPMQECKPVLAGHKPIGKG